MSRRTYTYSCKCCGVLRQTRSGRRTETCMDCREQSRTYEIWVPDERFQKAVKEIRGW